MGHYVTACLRASKIDRDGQMQITLEIPYTQMTEAAAIAKLVRQNLHVTVFTEQEFRAAKRNREVSGGETGGAEVSHVESQSDQSGPV